MVEFLLGKIELANKKNAIDKALVVAAGNGHEDIVKLLLKKGANVNAKDEYDKTPLIRAAQNGHKDIVELLLEREELTNKEDVIAKALIYAAVGGHKDIVKLLLKKGADVNVEDIYDRTPLICAAQNDHKEIVKLLLENGADVNVEDIDKFVCFAKRYKLEHEFHKEPIERSKNGFRVLISHLLNKKEGFEEKYNTKEEVRTILANSGSNIKEDLYKILNEEFIKSFISPDNLLKDKDKHYLKEFFICKSSSNQSSPHALFNIKSAIGGDDKPFSSLTSPSQEPIKKNIILDENSFKLFNKEEIPINRKKQIVENLVQNGFNVFLYCQDNEFINLKDKTNEEIEESLNKGLGQYSLNEKLLEKLVKHGPSIATDNIFLPNGNQLITNYALSLISDYGNHNSDASYNLLNNLDLEKTEIIIKGLLNEEIIVQNALNPAQIDNTSASNPDQRKNTIYISKTGDNIKIDDESGGKAQTFNMEIAGEVLSGVNPESLKVRDVIFELKIKSKSGITLTAIKKVEFTKEEEINIIQDQDLDQYKKATDGAYVRFTSNLRAKKGKRLYSIDAQEELVGVLGDATDLVIKRGDDGFFYATSQTDKEISYVLKADKSISVENKLSDENPIQKIINDYKNKDFVMTIGANYEMPKIEKGDIKAWKEKVYNKRSGACRHRVAVVYDKIINQHPDQKGNVRITGINGNHVILEARADSRSNWIGINLGGAEANLNYNEPKNKSKTKSEIRPSQSFLQDHKSNSASSSSKDSLNKSTPSNSIFLKLFKSFKSFISNISKRLSVSKKIRISPETDNTILAENNTNQGSETQEYKAASDLVLLANHPREHQHAADNANPRQEGEDFIKDKIIELLKSKKQPSKINSLESLESKITIDKLASKKTLLVNKNHKDISLLTLTKLRKDGFEQDKIFYLNNPSQVFQTKHLNISKAEEAASLAEKQEAEILPSSKFKKFLENQTEDCTIIIDWSAFSNKQILALNTILDKEPTFEGQKIPNPTIISIATEIPNDASFISRHNECLKISDDIDIKSAIAIRDVAELEAVEIDPILASQTNLNQTITIDLQGFPDWKQKLFGSIALNKDKIEWSKSEFCQKLEEGYHDFKIINISKSAKEEFKQELKLAKSSGYYDYFGYKFSSNLTVNFVENNLDFSQFFKEETRAEETRTEKTEEAAQSRTLQINCKERSTITNIPDHCQIINSYNFDFLLKEKEIKDRSYSEKEGLIVRHKDKELNLFLTSKLSDQQYYCLCEEALKHNVTLNLYLAESVELPTSIKTESIRTTDNPSQTATSDLSQTATSDLAINSDRSQNRPQIFVSNNPEMALQEIKKEHKDLYAVIDTEDYNYSDLFKKTEFKINGNSFTDFKEVESEFYQMLKEGKKIVLKGEFSDDFLEILHPILGGRDPAIKISDNLILLIEDKTALKDQEISYLKFLDKKDYQVKEYEPILKTTSIANMESGKIYSEDDFQQSKEKSDEFIKQRKEDLVNILKEDHLVQMVGHSGVGKTQLVKRLEEDSGRKYVVYNEIANFEKWANDTSDKVKILFIDESNIEDSHLTKFSPLKDKDKENIKILHNRKFYELGKNHKVIFARNPENYSASRNTQKLFDQDVKSLYLRDFPSCYIYEEILKAPIYDQLLEQNLRIYVKPDLVGLVVVELVGMLVAVLALDVG